MGVMLALTIVFVALTA
ncbi:hypothetical protein, partial [Sedimentibacter sp.]